MPGALCNSHKCSSWLTEWNPSTGPCLFKKGPFLGLPKLLTHSLTFIDLLGRDSHPSGLIDSGARWASWAWGNPVTLPCHSEQQRSDREPCMHHSCKLSFQGSLWSPVGWEQESANQFWFLQYTKGIVYISLVWIKKKVSSCSLVFKNIFLGLQRGLRGWQHCLFF